MNDKTDIDSRRPEISYWVGGYERDYGKHIREEIFFNYKAARAKADEYVERGFAAVHITELRYAPEPGFLIVERLVWAAASPEVDWQC